MADMQEKLVPFTKTSWMPVEKLQEETEQELEELTMTTRASCHSAWCLILTFEA